jgi:rhamnosyl/mannosyltransferase
MKKILQVNKLYYPTTGGIERIVQQIAEGLNTKTDMKVIVCQNKGKGSEESINGVKVYRTSSFGILFSVPISLSFIWKLRVLSKDRDILHFHMPFPLGDVAGLLSGFKGKIVVWWHSDIIKQKKLMLLYKPIMDRFLERADVIIVATEGHINGSNYLHKYRKKCVVIPFGVDSLIEKRSDEYLRLNQKKSESVNNEIEILFVGRLVYYKGCEVLIEALSYTNGANLTIIGSGYLEKDLKQKAMELGIEKKVKFLGSVNDDLLSKYFSEADVFILPSIARSEAFGLVQIEAMSYGKPVINTNLASGVPYVSIDKETGLTVEPNNANELAKAIQWMVDNKEERLLMGIRAKERVKSKFQMDKMLTDILALYEKI